MAILKVEEVYERFIKPLPPADQERLLKMARENLDVADSTKDRFAGRLYTSDEVSDFINTDEIGPETASRVLSSIDK